MMVTSTCGVCSNEFEAPDWEKRKFCSKKCSNARGKKTAPCPQCGKPFLTWKGGKTCSVACGRALQRSRNPNRNKTCEQCGQNMPERVKPNTRFCSRSCSMKARASRGTGRGHASPEGSTVKGGSGYTSVKVGTKWIAEHRHVMAQTLGRELEAHERVHHRNGDRSDNRPENLELWKVTKKDPAGVRASDYHCAGCRCSESG